MVLTRSQASRLLQLKQSSCQQPVFKQRAKTNSHKPGKFPLKLWNIVESKDINSIEWRKDGTVIGIDPVEFQYILRTNRLSFKTVNFKAFLRQLNIYGFRKVNSETNYLEYEHPFFRKNKPILSKVLRNKHYNKEQIDSNASFQDSAIEIKKENSIDEGNLSEDVKPAISITRGSENLIDITPHSTPQDENLNNETEKETIISSETVQVEGSQTPDSVYVHYNYYGKIRSGKCKDMKSYWDASFADDTPANAYFF